MAVKATDGFRMNVLIRRRGGVSREELIANWFANHMPAVIKNAAASAKTSRVCPVRPGNVAKTC